MSTVPPHGPGAPRSVVLLGLPFHDVTVDETLTHIDRFIAERRPVYLATANLDFAAQAARDPELQRILVDAELVLCDGMPLVWISRWFGAPLRARAAGADLVPKLVGHAARKGHSLFFFGSSDEILEAASQRLRQEHPGIRICGAMAPPRSGLLEMDHQRAVAAIRDARPDILLVALGCPKQEKWIWMHHRSLGVPCCIGIGASLDFVAGSFRRAPGWLSSIGLEWLYRLGQEPRWLLGRYSRDLLFLLRGLARQRRALRRARAASAPPAPPRPPPTPAILHWEGRADAEAVHAGSLPLPDPDPGRSCLCLDLSRVEFMDSTGLAHLLRARRDCATAGVELVLLRPSPQVVSLLSALFLTRVFRIEREPPPGDEPRGVVTSISWLPEEGALELVLAGELTVETAPGARERVSAEWERHPEARSLRARCERLRFMDSSGLGALLALSKLAASRGQTRLVLLDLPDNVRGVIQMARLPGAFEIRNS